MTCYDAALPTIRCVLVILVACLPSVAQSQTATLAWDPSADIPITDATGFYRVSLGVTAGTYSQSVDVGNVQQTTITLPAFGTFFFVVQGCRTTSVPACGGLSSEVFGLFAPPPPPPVSVCVSDPLIVSGVKWPASNTGARSLTFNVGAKRWLTALLTWKMDGHHTLLVTDTRGCAVTVTK